MNDGSKVDRRITLWPNTRTRNEAHSMFLMNLPVCVYIYIYMSVCDFEGWFADSQWIKYITRRKHIRWPWVRIGEKAGGTCRVLNQVHSIFSLDQLRERSDLVLSLFLSCQVGLFDLHCALELIQAFAVTLLRIEHTYTHLSKYCSHL